MRIIASIKKGDEVRYISHLDIQRSLQRTVRRAGLPVSFSQGFNPHPLISFATALSVGQTGDNEWVDIRFDEDITPAEFIRRMNANFPAGMSVTDAYIPKEGTPSVASMMEAAEYTASASGIERDAFLRAINEVVTGDRIIVTKSKKQNGKKVENAEVDIKPMLYDFYIVSVHPDSITVHTKGRLDAAGGLNMELLLRAINEKAGQDVRWRINRDRIVLGTVD